MKQAARRALLCLETLITYEILVNTMYNTTGRYPPGGYNSFQPPLSEPKILNIIFLTQRWELQAEELEAAVVEVLLEPPRRSSVRKRMKYVRVVGRRSTIVS
jgi:hypothetical protein